ncbi:MAG: beta-ketoacyl-ACP synthase II [Bdellovibrionaceae bacterium]|nr:beta-ketoacyl-ACP synthase II [Pseudobdellovibrionaceae bacterium]NUM58194.1 beta-ketoacyl-ACP synthase II [Pseudobdellovibrionaceae bacterium]
MNSRFEKPSQPVRRVVITGIGAISPLGLNIEETWSHLLKGKSGISKITKFDTTGFDTQIAGEVKGFNPDLYIEKKEQKKMDTFIHYGIACTKMALEMANLKLNDEQLLSTGVFVSTGMGGLPMIEEQLERLRTRGPGRISPFFIPGVITNLASGQVSIAVGAKGPNYSITSACATGVHSIGEAYNYIRYGKCEYMLAGGVEATVCPSAIGGFGAMRALSTRNDSPEKASRPFDKDRDGFVLSEGGAVFVLESMEGAIKRGANILCEISGYGASSDASHFTTPAPEGEGGRRAMFLALKDSGLSPEQIDYVNAHATSTPVGDGLETLAIKNLFKDHSKKLWVSGTKSMTGHLLGAAGALESAICIMSLRDQIAPPTINIENLSEECDLDYIPDHAREGKITHALNNSFGFGGTNGCLIFSKVTL